MTTLFDCLDLLDPLIPGTAVGKHSIWEPPSAAHHRSVGIKVPFQFGGRVQKYKKPHEASYSLDTLAEEYALLRWLADRGWAPPIGNWVYFKTVISEHIGAWWADPCGAYGWEMADASKLSPGPVTPALVASLRQQRGEASIEGSDGAWNDLLLPERGNILNGYIIDVRRSWFDRLRFLGPVCAIPLYREDLNGLVSDLRRDGQFPFREREQPYQEYYLAGKWFQGEREVGNRTSVLGFTPRAYESVLDLGCCTGGFLQLAHLIAPRARLVGLDSQPEFVDLARRLARANGMNICYRQYDLRELSIELFQWLADLFPKGADHLLVLSMGKHLGEETMWALIDILMTKMTYIETNAVKGPPYPYARDVVQRGGTLTGMTSDRNRRVCYAVSRAGRQ